MKDDYYQCCVCGMRYEYQRKAKNCETTHESRLTDHSNSEDLRKLEGLMTGLRNNDYDKKDIRTDKTKQHTLRNREIREKKLKDF